MASLQRLGEDDRIFAVLNYAISEDWSAYYDKNYNLTFDVHSSSDIKSISFGMKGEQSWIVEKEIALDGSVLRISFPLQTLVDDANKLSDIKQLGFVLFYVDIDIEQSKRNLLYSMGADEEDMDIFGDDALCTGNFQIENLLLQPPKNN